MPRPALLVVVCAIALFPPARGQVASDTLRVLYVVDPDSMLRADTVTAHPGWGGTPPPGGLVEELVLADDGFGGHVACEPPVNGSELAGRVALIARGICTYSLKAYYAQQAGAVAFLIYNHDHNPTDGDSSLLVMGPGDHAEDVTIPGAFLPRYLRDALVPAVEAGVHVTVNLCAGLCGPDVIPPVPTDEGAGAVEAALGTPSPHPFHAAATLPLTLRRAQAVRVDVFDALGRRVALLHDDAFPAGTHVLSIDGVALPSGVYVVRAVGETFVATRRVVRGH